VTSVGSGPAVRGLIVQYTCLESYILLIKMRERDWFISRHVTVRALTLGTVWMPWLFSLLAVGSRITNRRCQLRKFLTVEET